MEFTDKVVWLTGGGGRIGRAIAQAFTREGAALGILDIDGARAEQTLERVRAAGGRGVALRGDVSVELHDHGPAHPEHPGRIPLFR